MKRIRPWSSGVVLVAIASLIVAACSGSGASSAPSAAPTAVAATAAPSTGVVVPEDSPTVKRIREAGKLVGGVGPVLPWTGLDTATGEYFGPSILIAKAIAERIGVPLELKPVGNDIVVQETAAGNIDLALYPLWINPDRLEVIDMVPWTYAGFCWLVLKDNNKLNTVEDLNKAGVRFQVFDGFPFGKEIGAAFPNATIQSRPITGAGDSGITDLLAGRADVAYLDNPLIYAYLDAYPQLKSIPPADECINDPQIPLALGLGSPKGDLAFDAFLEKLYVEMEDDILAELKKYADPRYISVPKP